MLLLFLLLCTNLAVPAVYAEFPSKSVAWRRSYNSKLQACLSEKSVPVVYASSSSFAQLAEPFNLRLPYTPAVIAVPTTPRHISDAVVCASKNNVKVQPKSGGHSYASFSSGGKNGSMVIDLQSFQEVSVDNKTGIATVGGGVRLGNLALAIYNQSQRALPHGTCAGIGIGGHATHGGFGYSSRAWGLTLDTIVALDVVLANGSFIHATETEYPDIYYALRGAACDFGIITTFYLQTLPAPKSVVNFAFDIPGMFSSAAETTSVFLHFQSLALNASIVDRRLGVGIFLDGTSFIFRGTFFGEQSEFTKIETELLKGIPTPSSSSVQVTDWITSLTMLAAPDPLQEPTTGYNLHDDFFAKSLVVPATSPLTADAMNSYFTYVIKNLGGAQSSWFTIINLYGGPDSQINVHSPSASAYSDRDSLWVFQNYADTSNYTSPFPAADIPYIAGLNTAVTSAMPETEFGAYLNYVDPTLTPAEAHQLYYGNTTYEKLLAIKEVVDPSRVFWNPQSVGN